jgi:hypothetical protein
MLPDLLACTNFVQFRLEESLLRCWLKLPRARDHTDLYVCGLIQNVLFSGE